MKKLSLWIGAVLFTGLFQSLLAQSAEDNKAWQAYRTPAEQHKKMAKEVGTWEGELTQWMDPAAPPTKTKATNVVTMSMNGLFQVGNFTSTMMNKPMVGQSITGYDNARKMYVSTWVDNLGSGMIYMTGNFDEATQTLNFKGMQTDARTGGESELREEMKWTGDDAYTLTMYGAGMDGKEMKFLEGTFKRKMK